MHRPSARARVSRDTACRIIGEILGSWDNLRRIATVSEITLNKALESELEAMFVERLRQSVRGEGGKLNKIVVGGHPGYFIRLGAGEWHLEPQVEVHRRFPNMPPTRADFVVWPAVPISGVKPIAIYLDGWQWHADRIADDLALRQKLIRSRQLLVWSLSWDDMERNVEDGRPKHYWDPLSPVPRDRIEKLTDGAVVANDLQDIVGASSFDHLLRLLHVPDPATWTKRARNISTSLFLNGMTAGKEKNKVMADTEAMAGHEGLSTIDAVAATASFGIVNTTGAGTVTVAADRQWLPPAWPAPDALTTVVGFEHQLAVSSEAKRAWNGALRLLNLLQFLPWIFVGCRGGIPLSPAIRPSTPHTADGWAEIERLVLADIMPLVDRLRQRSVTLPEALFEVTNPDGSVAGTLELAWPDQKVGVVLDRNLVRLFPGWTVVVYSGNDDEAATIIGDEL